MPTTQTVEPQTAADPAAQNTQAPAEQPNAEAEGKAKSLQDARAALSAAVVEMKAAFPNDLEFALDAAARGLSVQAAKAEAYDAILGRLTAELETVRGELAEARKRLEVVAKGGVHGPTPRPSDSRGEGVPAGDDGQPETYESAVAGFKADGKTASQAHREAILRFPRATAAWRAAQPEYDRS